MDRIEQWLKNKIDDSLRLMKNAVTLNYKNYYIDKISAYKEVLRFIEEEKRRNVESL